MLLVLAACMRLLTNASYSSAARTPYTVVVDSMGDMFNWRLEGAGDEEEEEEQLQEVMQSISDWTKTELKVQLYQS